MLGFFCRVEVVGWVEHVEKMGVGEFPFFFFGLRTREVVWGELFVCCPFASQVEFILLACVSTQVVVWRWVGCGRCLFAEDEHGRCLVISD